MKTNKPAILALIGSIVCTNSTAAESTDLDHLNAWLTIVHAMNPWQNCPTAMTTDNTSAKSTNPYFAFNGTFVRVPLYPQNWGACKQSGPFVTQTANPKVPQPEWWVQVVTNLRSGCDANGANCTFKDLIRVCSLAFVDPKRTTGVPGGPCGTTKGVGPSGCEVCAVPDA